MPTRVNSDLELFEEFLDTSAHIAHKQIPYYLHWVRSAYNKPVYSYGHGSKTYNLGIPQSSGSID